jgi:sugar lactone lactonase YvrE
MFVLAAVSCSGGEAGPGGGTSLAPPSGSTTAATTGGSTGADETTSAPGEATSGSSSSPATSTDGTTRDGEGSSGAGPDPGPSVDCDVLPQGPLPYTIKVGPKASEDLAFDHEGNLVGAADGNLFRSPYDGEPTLWVAGAGGFIAGLRATSSGVFIYADNDVGSLIRINPQGNKEVVLGGLLYANGLEVDLDGHIYVAEQEGGRVRRVDVETGEFTIVAEGLESPNGLSFSPNYRKLYVGSFGGGTITTIDLDDGSVELLRDAIGYGLLDGMAVDACGNIYVCEYGGAALWRVSPDGQALAPLAEFTQHTMWIPNLQWGSGVGGWDRQTLYVLDFSQNRVFEVPVGVPDKPRGYP